MVLKLFNTGAAMQLGESLAKEMAAVLSKQGAGAKKQDFTHLLQRIDQEVRPLNLGWLGRSRLANAFKWKLREEGVSSEVVDELTNVLVLHMSRSPTAGATADQPAIKPNRAMRRRMAREDRR